MGKILGVIAMLVAVVGIFIGVGIASFSNQEVALRQQYMAKVEANKSDFDALYKTIKQVAQVPDQAKEAFKDIFTSYAQARSGGDGGQLMKWVQESVPGGTFDMSLFARVQTVVEAQRATFSTRQKELVDIRREHSTLIHQLPGGVLQSPARPSGPRSGAGDQHEDRRSLLDGQGRRYGPLREVVLGEYVLCRLESGSVRDARTGCAKSAPLNIF